MNRLPAAAIADFLQTLQRYYEEAGRHDMLWRAPEPDGSFDPYKILVSELMLQQTQVARVTPKFAAFIGRYPDVQALARAEQGEVLGMWSGLGYNRRAKFLHQAARAIVDEYGGDFPRTLAELQNLPGVGPNTAGAIMAYAYNQPVVYLETNIRTVLIHHFFKDEAAVPDKLIREMLEQILAKRAKDSADHQADFDWRKFYWAMMDYGAYLKKTIGNLNRISKSYSRQSTFRGSRRQVRGQVIRLLTEQPLSIGVLAGAVSDQRLESVLADLVAEGLVQRRGDIFSL
jgi:A/G-specific adenine glycosylase